MTLAHWTDTERERLFAEADRRNRLAMIEEAAKVERINAMLDRSVWRENPSRDGRGLGIAVLVCVALFLSITANRAYHKAQADLRMYGIRATHDR